MPTPCWLNTFAPSELWSLCLSFFLFLSFSLSLYFWLIPWSLKAGCVTQGILASFLFSLSHCRLWTTRFRSIKGPIVGWGLNDMRFLFKVMNIFKIHICEYTKSHWIAYFKWAICMVYGPYHNKTAVKHTHTHTHTHTQEYWSELPCPPLGHLPDPEIKPSFPPSPASKGRFFITRSMHNLPLWMWMVR